uniref:Zinc finger SWIM-type containing 8 n=1 Tax=Saimiri boliviensis boliviensis TaxID=39432 RepID=A0A2K6TAC6_SAIBB
MELMFAEWEDGERFSFEDSDRFEEDSLCSFISEAESLCQNWRGWRKQSAGPNSPTGGGGGGGSGGTRMRDGLVIPLVELSAKQVAFHIPFEVVEKVYPPVPEQLQLRIAFWSFPENEEDIRLYSCLANGSADEFQRGDQLFRMRAVKDPLQIGFHLSATVVPPQMVPPKGAYNVAVMFDRCRVTSCSCTCGAGAKWCTHVVALCLFRIHNASAVCLRAPVSESLSRLQRDQLQKFAQYLISELPQQILPTAQRLLDELLSSQSTAINTVCGAPDPTAGPSASDQSTWYLDESTLTDNIKKTLHKFCGPSPVVFSDVNSMYLSSTEPPAAAEWACLLRPLRGREPEGVWNLLSIVREMFKRRDSNAAPFSEASRLTVELAQDLLANPPDLKVEPPPAKGKKNKVSTSRQTWVATNTLSKAAFLLTVLSERPEHHNLAFRVGMFALELQRPPASTKALEVKLAYQESEVAALLKKIPLGPSEMSTMRCRAEELREGTLCDYRPVLPLMLASFIFDVLCAPVVSPTGSRPPSRNWNSETPGDEELGFEAAVAALGMKTTVSEAEHPLLCEGTRREKGDLALALMITYKDDQAKLKKILDKLLDRESQTHKPQTLSSFYSSSRPATASQRSPSKHGGPSAPGALQPLTSGSAGPAQPGSVAGAGPGPTEGFTEKNVPESSPHSPCEGLPSEAALTPRPEGKVPSRLALGSRGGYNGRGWGSPGRPKKKHTGMASIDSSAPETTSDSSPTLSRRPLRGGWAPTSWGRGQDSDSISSSSSDSLGSSSSSGSRRASASGGARAKTVEVGRYKGRRPESHAPHVPNQPSEAAAHFYFELAKTVLIKAGGNSSTSIFTHPSSSGGHQGPHRNLHLCAFEIGLYALGLHNFVSPNWLSRTYSSHVSWITGQAMEIGSAALTILVECWDGHLTPPEVASLADRASRARDSNMVRAAAELALSCLPHAHALNPNEIQRALVQCKEQDNLMLEKACMAVEEAAKGGGVYPEVLFEVAHQWFWLYEQTAGGSSTAREGATGCSASGIRAAGEAGRGLTEGRGGPGTEPVTVAAAAAVTAAATVVPVISVGSSLYPGPGLGHGHSPGLHPYTALQPHLPCSPQYLTHPAHPAHPMPHMPRPAVFPVPSSAYPQGVHPAFLGAQYPYSVTPPSLAATAVSFPVPSMAPITVHPYHTEPGLPLPTSVALSSVHPASTFPAIQGASLPALTTQPSPLVSGGFPPPEEETHSQPVNPHSLHHLHAAYRVGMLALEMLGRRAHNDHPNNFSRSPPYTDDVKWLLGLAAKLGVNYVHQFCVGAAKGVLSPFVLQEIVMETLQRLSPAHAHNHLRAPAFHQLVQRCQQAYMQYIHHRLIHLTPADYDDFVNAIRSARSAFCLTPMGMMQFNDILQNLKRSKQTKELWQRVSLEMATFSP